MTRAVQVSAPRLLFFSSAVSGRGRRTEGYLAQVLQHRHNHVTFDVRHITVEDRPDLASRFRISKIPTLLVIVDDKVAARIIQPRGARELEQKLHEWLR